jgi:glycerol-3-phosphate dehydrogenase
LLCFFVLFLGPQTLKDVMQRLKKKNLLDQYPLFCAVHKICYENHASSELVRLLKGLNVNNSKL